MSKAAVLGGALFLASASAAAQPSAEDLLDLDIAQLLELPVSVASRSQQRSGDAAAAVYVIDAATLRRSGIQRLPDALRLVPGFHVGKWDANKWAISSRNSMGRFTSTMLVLIDGRPAYTPLFGGVRWEIMDLPIDEIERIEVVRGPGGPLWGANAVDGIVSIVTRHSSATLGEHALLALGEGDVERVGEARIGRAAGDWTWRLSMRWVDSAPGLLPEPSRSTWTAPRAVGEDANDEGLFRAAMLRVDSAKDREGGEWSVWLGHRESTFNDQRLVGGQPRDNSNRIELDYASAEWRTQPIEGQNLALRGSVHQLVVGDSVLWDDQRVVDIDFQHDGVSGRHTWAWGLGLNHYRSDTRTPPRFAVPPCTGCFGANPQVGTDTKRSFFAQNQTALNAQWSVILGAKLEDSRSMQWEWQPTARLRWQPTEQQTFWSSWTRALRSSTRLERDGAFFNVPANLVTAFRCRTYAAGVCGIGNPEQEPWVVDVAELGWRSQVTPNVALDVAAFRSDYSNLAGQPGDRIRERVQGVEVVAQWTPSAHWSVNASATRHQGRDRFIGTALTADSIFLPKLNGQLHVQWSPHADVDVDVRWWKEGARDTASTRIGLLPAYHRVDLRLAWRPANAWEAALAIGNANDDRPVEYLEGLRVNTAVPRSITFSLSRSLP